MSKEGQDATKSAYVDPEIVAGYVENHAKNPKMLAVVEAFAQTLPGRRVVDIGCGPGQDAYHFTELGYQVTALDYSPEMIKTAESLRQVEDPPHFQVADMREVGRMYPADSFDGAWVSASLIHIPEEDIPAVLDGIHKIVVKEGKVYVGLKGGRQGAQTITEAKYKKLMQREFVFWEKDTFQRLVESRGFKVENVEEIESGTTGDKPTSWLRFFLEVEK